MDGPEGGVGAALRITSGGNHQACAATDPLDAAQVAICDAVVNDGIATTCTGAGACTYTAARASEDAALLMAAPGGAEEVRFANEQSSADIVTLATADPTILPGHVIRLGDRGANSCEARPIDTDLVVDSVVGAVITLETDLRKGDAAASTNCVILDACDLVVNDGTAGTCEGAGTASQCTYTAAAGITPESCAAVGATHPRRRN